MVGSLQKPKLYVVAETSSGGEFMIASGVLKTTDVYTEENFYGFHKVLPFFCGKNIGEFSVLIHLLLESMDQKMPTQVKKDKVVCGLSKRSMGGFKTSAHYWEPTSQFRTIMDSKKHRLSKLAAYEKEYSYRASGLTPAGEIPLIKMQCKYFNFALSSIRYLPNEELASLSSVMTDSKDAISWLIDVSDRPLNETDFDVAKEYCPYEAAGMFPPQITC